MTEKIKIGLIADTHAGRTVGTKKGEMASSLLRQALRELTEEDVCLIVDLGDRVNNGEVSEEREALTEVGRIFQELQLPRMHLVGNHDVVSLSISDHEQALAAACRSDLVELNGLAIIQWVPDATIGPGGFTLSPTDLEWLAETVNRVNQPAILLSHIPISDASMVGNYYFEQFKGGPYDGGAGNYSNAVEARKILRTNPWISLCVAGHVHWNSIRTVDGVRHLTVQSLTESFTTEGRPAGAYAILELVDGTMNLDVRGLDPIKLSVPASFPRPSWPDPLREIPG